MRKKIFVNTDPHIRAEVAHRDDLDSARPVVIASRATSKAKSRHPQLDLEATAIDFAPCRFRNYLVESPQVFIITDHKPLGPIFNSYRQGSIRTDAIKLYHQNINYKVRYQQRKANQSNYS